jgi:hypothetical protein
MKFINLIIILILLIISTSVQCSVVGTALASVINKVQDIDDNETVLQVIQNMAPS